MLADKVRDLGFNGLSQQNTRPIAQDFGELVADVSWLNQFDDVIFGHGISLLQWRSGGVKHPHDMPPFRFLPSPTFGDSSLPLGANDYSEVLDHIRRSGADAVLISLIGQDAVDFNRAFGYAGLPSKVLRLSGTI